MARTPVIDTGGQVLNPVRSENLHLARWAADSGRGYYTQYVTVTMHTESDANLGVSILAGSDVAPERVRKAAATVKHLLLRAARSSTLLQRLAHAGARLLIAKDRGSWQQHPEVSRDFTTGLGGGAPWFPSTGIEAGEPASTLAEELFHTIQYTALRPREVCMYHRAYAHAMSTGLYTTDGSASEVDGEPVPTVQADEYMAQALHRWFGSNAAAQEYLVPGNGAAAPEGTATRWVAEGLRTGREQLRRLDPQAFCLLAEVFRSDDTWNPEPNKLPWRVTPNRGMAIAEVDTFCQPLLTKLAVGCPPPEVKWLSPPSNGRR